MLVGSDLREQARLQFGTLARVLALLPSCGDAVHRLECSLTKCVHTHCLECSLVQCLHSHCLECSFLCACSLFRMLGSLFGILIVVCMLDVWNAH